MWVTLWTIQWKWRLWDHGCVIKLLCMLRVIRLIVKYHNHIYHIIIDSWYPKWGFLRSSMPWHINRGEKVVKSDFNQICLNSLLLNSVIFPFITFSDILTYYTHFLIFKEFFLFLNRLYLYKYNIIKNLTCSWKPFKKNNILL